MFRRDWEYRLPGLDPPWTQWWIEGDDQFLAILSTDRLTEALDLIEANHEKYRLITVRRARTDWAGNTTYDDLRTWLISDRDKPFVRRG